MLTEYEMTEILSYEKVYYLGKPEEKIRAHVIKMTPDEKGKMVPNKRQ